MSHPAPSVLRQCAAVLRKDLVLAMRSRGRALAVLLFGVTVLLLFNFSTGARTAAVRDLAGAFFWLALLLASTLALTESFRTEVEDEALEGLVLLPVDPRALFYGKALANLAILGSLGALLWPLALGLFDATLRGSPIQLILLVLLGTGGLAGPGTLYAGMTARAKGSDVLLPLLLFPLVIPVVVSAAAGTAVVLQGDPMNQAPSWIGVLTVFNAVYWSACGLLFGKVVEA